MSQLKWEALPTISGTIPCGGDPELCRGREIGPSTSMHVSITLSSTVDMNNCFELPPPRQPLDGDVSLKLVRVCYHSNRTRN